MKRDLIAVIWSLLVTGAISKWAFHVAYLERGYKAVGGSVLVNMTLLRKTAAAKAMTGAILRVIRALTGMKCQYTKKELQKPFAIPRVTFSPDYTDPEVRKAMLSQGMNSIGSLFGATPNIVAIHNLKNLRRKRGNTDENITYCRLAHWFI